MKCGYLIIFVAAIFGPNLITGFEVPGLELCEPERELFQPHHVHHCHYIISGQGNTSSIANELIGFHMTCYPTIHAIGGCGYWMMVQNCTWINHGRNKDGTKSSVDPANSIIQDISRYPIQFVMANGKVLMISAHKSEPMHILNFKRGIISSILMKNASDTVQKNGHQSRTDVHGTCPAQYRKSGSGISMTKKMSECNYPQKADFSFSPWSLWWNMTFLQKLAIDSKATCHYLKGSTQTSVKCIEEHTLRLHLTNNTGSDFQTVIRQEITALESKPLTKLSERLDTEDFRMVDIQYEHEREEIPDRNPEDLKTKAISLMEDLVQNPEKPIEIASTQKFEDLVDLLRRSADLKDMTLGLPSCWNSQSCRRHSASSSGFNDFKIQMAQTWRDALVQCNRLPCFKGLRTMLNMNREFMDKVITTNYLNMVFLSWAHLNVPNIEFLSEMLEMCKLRPTRPCLLSLTTAVHAFWRHNKEKLSNELPRIFHHVVNYISSPIGSECMPGNTYTREQIMVSLAALANLGEVAEMVQDDLSQRLHACTTNTQTYWPINVLAIQATWRFKPTEAFHERLLKTFRNSSGRQDIRVLVFEVLQKNWADESLVREVLAILGVENENFNLKTFLASSLKEAAMSQDPSKSSYSEAIREAMNENQELFQFRTGGYVSQHVERNFRIIAPFLENPADTFGYRLKQAVLRNPETFLPFSLTDDLQVELFGKTFDLYEVYGNSRGMMKSYEVFLSYFFNMQTLNLTQATQSVFKLLNIVVDKKEKPEAINKFAYTVDENILQNLLRIRKDRVTSLTEAFSWEHAAIFKLKLLGDVLGLTTSDLIQEDIYDIIQSWVVPPLFPSDLPIFTSRTRILEAAFHVPTLAGLPLKWTLDSQFIHSLKENRHLSYMNPHYKMGFNFSSLATLRAQVMLDFPGQTGFGVQALSASSTSVGATLKFMHSFAKKTLTVSVELPQRPLQWLSLTRQHTLFHKSVEADQNPDAEAAGPTQWCYRKLFPHLGTQWCQNRARYRHYSKSWLFIGQSSNWNLTSELNASQHRVLEFNLAINPEADSTETFGINLRAVDPKIPNKFTDIATYRHDWHKGRDEHRIEFKIPKIPHLNLTAAKRPTDSGYELHASATLLPNRTFAIQYMTKSIQVRGSESMLRYHKASGSQPIRMVPTEYHIINITTPTEYYSWNYRQQRYPLTFVADLEMKCHSFQPWLWQVKPTDSINRKDFQELSMAIHHESQYSIENLSTASLPHLSYNYLKTSSSILELETFSGSLTNSSWVLHSNLTQRNLPSNQLMTFLNFSMLAETQNSGRAGVESRVYTANARIPFSSLTAGLQVQRSSTKDLNCSLFFYKENEENQVVPWIPSNAYLKINPIRLNIHWDQSHSGDNTEVLDNNSMHKLHANLTYGPETMEAKYLLEYAKASSQLTYKSLLESSALKLRWESTVDANLKAHKSSIESKIFRIPDGVLATYRASLILSQDNTLEFLGAFDSKWCSSKSQLSYRASVGDSFSLDATVKANSTIWGLGTVNLQHKTSKKTTKTTFETQLLQYTFQGNWSDRAQGSFQVKSKNLEYIPNVSGNVEHSPLTGGVLHLSLPGVPKDIFFIYEKSPSSTELKYLLCFDRKCKDATNTPGSFLGRLIFTVVEGKDLTNTLVYSKNYSKLTKQLIRAKFGLKRTANNTQPDGNGRLHHEEVTISQLLGPTFRSMGQEADKILSGFYDIPESLAPLHDQVFGTIELLNSYFLTHSSFAKLLQVTRLSHLYNHNDLNRRLPRWIYQGVTSLALGYFSAPGISFEKGYSIKVPLPVYRWKLNTYPNPAFYRLVHRVWPLTPESVSGVFQSSKLTRFALYIGQGNIYTFDGRPLPMETMLNPTCAYLLSHDFEQQRFTIYYQNQKFHFLFADTRLILTQKGEISVNGTQKDLPFEHWNGEFKASRKENLVELDTKYNLKVICDVDATYCIFYSNVWKFNQLIGLLGNNNDNPGDDVKGLIDNRHFNEKTCQTSGKVHHLTEYELTGSAHCRVMGMKHPVSVQKHDPVCNSFSRFLGSHSATFMCHDIVPADNFQYLCENCSQSPCATVKAYLAICDAQQTPTGLVPASCVSCNGHGRGQEWTEKVVNKLEVIFLIDQAKSGKTFAKELGNLASSIDTKFTEFGYSTVRFGIVGFHGIGFRSAAKQHTINSKLMANLQEFRTHGLKSLSFAGPNDSGGSAPFDAISHAANHYSLDPTARHVFILITHKDPMDIIYAKEMLKALKAMVAHQVELYVFSNYDSIIKRLWRFQAKGYTSSQEGSRMMDNFAEGQYSRMASATGGSLWQLSHLKEGGQQQQIYLDAVAEDMVNRGTREVITNRNCTCNAPIYHQVHTQCHVATP